MSAKLNPQTPVIETAVAVTTADTTNNLATNPVVVMTGVAAPANKFFLGCMLTSDGAIVLGTCRFGLSTDGGATYTAIGPEIVTEARAATNPYSRYIKAEEIYGKPIPLPNASCKVAIVTRVTQNFHARADGVQYT